MKVTFLGTGSSTPSPKVDGKPFRSYSSTMVELDDRVILFDIGPGTIHKMLQLGIDIQNKPTDIFISHFHLDHCLDLISLMKARGLRYAYSGEKNMLNIYGPSGLNVILNQLFSGIDKWNYMDKELKVFELMDLKECTGGVVVENDKFKVRCTPVNHYNGVAYRFEAQGKSITYSGDMGYDEKFAELGHGTDLAVVECSYPDRVSLRGLHLYPEEIKKLAIMGGFKKVALTHMYPACEGREEDMKKTIELDTNTETFVTEDFFTLDL